MSWDILYSASSYEPMFTLLNINIIVQPWQSALWILVIEQNKQYDDSTVRFSSVDI